MALMFVALTPSLAFRSMPHSAAATSASVPLSLTTSRMGLFDNLAKAFANEEFKEDDQRVRASHILIKGDEDVETITQLMVELGERVQRAPERLGPIFAEIARRESQCSSSSQGGDLGTFGVRGPDSNAQPRVQRPQHLSSPTDPCVGLTLPSCA